METRTYQVCKFNELTDEQKQLAIQNYYDINTDHEWWDFAYEDFTTIGKILGIDIEQIWFRGFSSQGDGLCFEGSFEYAKGWKAKLEAHAPGKWKDPKTGKVTENKHNQEYHAIGERLQELQRLAFYGVNGSVKHRGHYNHSGCTEFDVRHNWDDEVNVNFDDEDFVQIYRELMDTFYSQLNREYDYLTSDECIGDTLQGNEYEFTADGKID